MSTVLTKAKLIEIIYETLQYTKNDAKNTIELLLYIIKYALRNEKKVLLSGFGKFEAHEKQARKGRNPQTKKSIKLEPRKVITFKLSKNLRMLLNKV